MILLGIQSQGGLDDPVQVDELMSSFILQPPDDVLVREFVPSFVYSAPEDVLVREFVGTFVFG